MKAVLALKGATLVVVVMMAVIACRPAQSNVQVPTARPTLTPTPIVQIVTATPTITPTPGPVPPSPTPTAVPTPTPVPTATSTPAPTPTPVVIVVTAVVTATNTPTPAPTHTPTPTPTATPRPDEIITLSGTGAKLTSGVPILSGRPVRITLEADDDPNFGAFLNFSGSCSRELIRGGQVYWKHPSSSTCADRILPNRSATLEVVARSGTSWSVEVDMRYGETQQFGPLSVTGQGSGFIAPTLIQKADVIELSWSGGPIEARAMRLYASQDGHSVPLFDYELTAASSSRVFEHEVGTYMLYVLAGEGVSWTLGIR